MFSPRGLAFLAFFALALGSASLSFFDFSSRAPLETPVYSPHMRTVVGHARGTPVWASVNSAASLRARLAAQTPMRRRPALVILTHDRLDNLETVLEAFAALPGAGTAFTVYVSCDLDSMLNQIREVTALASVRGIVSDVWLKPGNFSVHLSTFHERPLFKISEHFR